MSLWGTVIRGRRKLSWMDIKEVESLRGEVDEAKLMGQSIVCFWCSGSLSSTLRRCCIGTNSLYRWPLLQSTQKWEGHCHLGSSHSIIIVRVKCKPLNTFLEIQQKYIKLLRQFLCVKRGEHMSNIQSYLILCMWCSVICDVWSSVY